MALRGSNDDVSLSVGPTSTGSEPDGTDPDIRPRPVTGSPPQRHGADRPPGSSVVWLARSHPVITPGCVKRNHCLLAGLGQSDAEETGTTPFTTKRMRGRGAGTGTSAGSRTASGSTVLQRRHRSTGTALWPSRDSAPGVSRVEHPFPTPIRSQLSDEGWCRPDQSPPPIPRSHVCRWDFGTVTPMKVNCLIATGGIPDE